MFFSELEYDNEYTKILIKELMEKYPSEDLEDVDLLCINKN